MRRDQCVLRKDFHRGTGARGLKPLRLPGIRATSCRNAVCFLLGIGISNRSVFWFCLSVSNEERCRFEHCTCWYPAFRSSQNTGAVVQVVM